MYMLYQGPMLALHISAKQGTFELTPNKQIKFMYSAFNSGFSLEWLLGRLQLASVQVVKLCQLQKRGVDQHVKMAVADMYPLFQVNMAEQTTLESLLEMGFGRNRA